MEWKEELSVLSDKYTPEGKNALIIFDEDEMIVSQQGNELFTAPSLTKLAVYLYYYEKAVLGKIDLTEEIEVPPQGRISGKGVLHLLPERENWTLEELLKVMMAVSDHEATNQLIAHVGLRSIQEWIETKKWKDEVKLRRYLMDYSSGLINEISANGAVSVLKDILLLAENYPDWKERIEFPLLRQQFRNGLPGSMNEKSVPVLEILNKTDEDNGMLHDVALFRYKEKQIYVAALTKEIQNEAQVYMWMQEIGKLIFQKIN